MHDFLVSEGDMGVSVATSLVAVFGLGAAVGGIGGGLLGTHVYSIKKAYLPLLMGSTLIAASLLMQLLLELCVRREKSLVATSVLIGLVGALASVNGALSRAVLLNVSSPYTRGAAVSSLTVVSSLGRGLGPAALTFVMHWGSLNRKAAMEDLICMWIVSGVIILAISFFINQDEEHMREKLRYEVVAPDYRVIKSHV
jgi:MFS family permease